MDGDGRKDTMDEDGRRRSQRTEARSRGRRRIVRVPAIIATVLLVIVVAIVLLLQFDPVSTRIVNEIARRVSPWPDATLSAGNGSLDGLGRIHLTDVSLVADGGETIGAIDTLALRIRPIGLLRNAMILPEVRIAGAEIIMRQQPDTTWDLLAPFRGEPDTVRVEEGRGMRIRIDTASIARSRLEVRFLAEHDSILRVDDILVRISGFSNRDPLAVSLDTVDLTILPPARSGSPGRLSARAALGDGRLAVAGLRLVSDSSDVSAYGTLLLPGSDADEISDVDFVLTAEPLDFRDIGAVVPGFDAAGSLRLESRIGGSASALAVDIDGRTNDGATVRVAGTLTPGTTGPVRYDLTGSVRDVDPALWGAGAPRMDGIDADFAVDLAGDSLRALDGTVNLSVSGVEAGGTSLDATTLAATFTAGRAAFNLEALARPWASVHAEGSIRPFDPTPVYDAIITARQLGGIGPQDGARVTAGVLRVDAEGAGFALDEAEGRARMQIRANVGNARITDGSVDARWAEGSATTRLELPLDDGRLRATGEIDWSGESPRFALNSLDADRLDVTALLGDTVETRLTANGRGEGVWRDARTARADLDFVVERARWRDLVVDTARATATLRAGRLAIDAVAHADAGTLTLEASGRPFDDVPEYRVALLQVDALDLARVMEGLPDSRIDATADFTFAGRSPADGRGNGTVVFDSARIGSTIITGANVELLLAGGEVQLGGDAGVYGGSVSFDGRARPFAEVVAFEVERARFQDIALDSLTGGAITSALSGTVRLEGRLPSGDFPVVDGMLELEGSTFNTGRIDGGLVTFAVANGIATLDAMLETAEGSIRADGRAQLVRAGPEESTRLADARLDATVTLPDLGDLASREPVAGRLDARVAIVGTSLDGGEPNWDVAVHADGRYDGAILDTLRVDATLAAGVLRLDTLRIASNVLDGSGGGAIAIGEGVAAPEPPLHVRIESDSVSAIATLVGMDVLSLRTGRLDLTATNMQDGIRAQLDFALAGVVTSGLGADTIFGDADALIRGGRLVSGEADLRVRYLALQTARFEGVAVQVAYLDDVATFAGGLRRDAESGLTVAGQLHAEQRLVRLDNMTFDLDEADWTLADTATVQWGDVIRIDDLRLVTDGRRIEVAGTLDRAGTQDLTVTLDSVDVEPFARFAGISGIVGIFDGTLRMEGPAHAVSLDGDLTATVREMVAAISLDTPDERLAITVAAEDGEGNRLSVEGSVPFVLSIAADEPATPAIDGALALDIRADDFSLGWLTPFLEPYGIDRLEGRLTAQASFEGTSSAPNLSGSAILDGGRIHMPSQGVQYDDLRARLSLGGQRIRVDTLFARAEGTARVEGDIVLESITEPRFELSGRFDRFRAARNEWTRLALSGDVSITGDMESPVIDGSVLVDDTDFYADPAGQGPGGATVTLTEEDYEMLRSYFGYMPERDTLAQRDLIEAWAMDVKVELGADVWARKRSTPEMRLQLGGSLDIRKEAGDSLQLFGTIEVDPRRSFFQQFGRRFSVIEGSVTFNGSIWSWIADLEAQYEVPSYTDPSAPEVVITLSVTGGWEDLSLVLGAQPDLETSDILSYLATGRPAASAAEFGGAGDGDGVLGTGASFALSQAASYLEDAASETVGLDVVEIRQDGLRGATLVAGRYVSPRLYVGFQQSLTLREQEEGIARRDRGTQIELEYEAWRWLLLNLQGGQSDYRFFFRTRRAF